MYLLCIYLTIWKLLLSGGYIECASKSIALQYWKEKQTRLLEIHKNI